MLRIAFISALCIVSLFGHAQQAVEPIVYLIPGAGSDGRLFKNLEIEGFETKVLEYEVPGKGEDMHAYSMRIGQQIDPHRPFMLVGVSLGGMLAVELSKVYSPEKVVLIASAKERSELPGLYRVFRSVPLYKIMGGRFYIFWTKLFQPIVEPLEKEDQKLWQSMIDEKDPVFMKRATACIVEWENSEYDPDLVVHIHGTKDRTLPYKNIQNAIPIEGGTHIMTLTKGREISALINEILQEN